MPSPVENDHQAMFGDEVEDEDPDSEMDMDEYSEEFDEELPPTLPVVVEEDLNSSPSSSTDVDDRVGNANPNPYPNPNPNPNPSNGSNNDNGKLSRTIDNTVCDPPQQQLLLQSAVPVSTSHDGQGIELKPAPPASVDLVGGRVLETPEAKRTKLEDAVVVWEERKPSVEESRKLFQRLWTDEDEIAILQGFYEFTFQRGTTHHAHQHDTGPFYDQIRTKLQLDFNKNQLVEKLRRLKKKYRNVISRMASGKEFSFKSPHDQNTFEISRKIWGNNVAPGNNCDQNDDDTNDGYLQDPSEKIRKRGRKRLSSFPSAGSAMAASTIEAVSVEVKALSTLAMPTTAVVSPIVPTSMDEVTTRKVVEETVRSCLSPLLKEMVTHSMGGPMVTCLGGGSPLVTSPIQLSFMGNSGNSTGSLPKEGEISEKWRKQQVLELEVYSKRLELLQEMIKTALEELR